MRGGRYLRVRQICSEQGLEAIDLIQDPLLLLPPTTAHKLLRNDKVRAVGFEILEKLSVRLGVPVEELWEWETKRTSSFCATSIEARPP